MSITPFLLPCNHAGVGIQCLTLLLPPFRCLLLTTVELVLSLQVYPICSRAEAKALDTLVKNVAEPIYVVGLNAHISPKAEQCPVAQTTNGNSLIPYSPNAVTVSRFALNLNLNGTGSPCCPTGNA